MFVEEDCCTLFVGREIKFFVAHHLAFQSVTEHVAIVKV